MATRFFLSLKKNLICGGTFPRAGFICLLQALPKFGRKLIKALFTGGLQIKLVKLGFLRHLCIANRACKMVNTPGFVQRGEHYETNKNEHVKFCNKNKILKCLTISSNNLVANEAKIAKKLVIVGLAIS